MSLYSTTVFELNSSKSDNLLVTFHYVGGNGRYLKPEAAYFEENNIKLLGVNIPGRTNEKDALTSISAIIEFLYPELKRVLLKLQESNPNLNVTFFGHSMGGIVAFELSRYFNQDIDEESLLPIISVSRLIVSAVRDPYTLSTFNSEPNNNLLNYKDSDEVIKNRAIEVGGLPVGIHPMFLQKAIPVMRKDYQALETYNESRQLWGGTKISCPLFVFIGDSDRYVGERDTKHWHMWTTSNTKVKHFKGGHFYFNESHIRSEFLITLRDLCLLPGSSSSPPSPSSSKSCQGGIRCDSFIEDLKSARSEMKSETKCGGCYPESASDEWTDSKTSSSNDSDDFDSD